MAPRRTKKKAARAAKAAAQGATTGYEAELWATANALRGSMDAAEYKHVVLGLIFLKYISDAFEETHARLEAESDEGADPEDADEYRASNVFWVPPQARWSYLQARGEAGRNRPARGRRDGGHRKRQLGPQGCLAEGLRPPGPSTNSGSANSLIWSATSRSETRRPAPATCWVACTSTSSPSFANAEGKKGGEFYTPRCVVRLLVEMIEPYSGRVYDPCCGSSGMFVQSVEFIEAHASGNGNARTTPSGARAGHLDLRSGVELHDLAARPDESGHPWNRRPDRAG